MTRRNTKSRRQLNQPQAVTVVDATDSTDQLKISRVFNSLDSTQSLINTVLEFTQTANVATTGGGFSVSFPQFTGLTDYSAFATEYRLFRIKAIMFDVYDTQPGTTGTAYFSTSHTNSGTALNPTMSVVTASVDVGIVPPGVGMKTWTWAAHGTAEAQFQACNGTIQDYGGLISYIPGQTTAVTNRFYIICRAHVQFKQRI